MTDVKAEGGPDKYGVVPRESKVSKSKLQTKGALGTLPNFQSKKQRAVGILTWECVPAH